MALNEKLFKFFLRGTWMPVPTFMAIHPKVVETFNQNQKDVNLMVAQEEQSGGHQSCWDSYSQLSVQNSMAFSPVIFNVIVAEIFQSGPKWWTDQQSGWPFHPSGHASRVTKNAVRNVNFLKVQHNFATNTNPPWLFQVYLATTLCLKKKWQSALP